MRRTVKVGIAVLAVLGLAACNTKTTPSSAAPTTVAVPTTQAAPVVLFQQSAEGAASTPNFTTPTDWNVVWSYDCSAFGYQGNFIVSVEQAGTGTMAAMGDIDINQLGMSGSGVQSYHYGGKLYLSVNSECSWSIKVVTG